jgi:hypothetical protein
MPAAVAVPLITGLAGAGASIASAVMGSNAASDASNLQYQSSQDALNFQKQVYGNEQAQIQPYLQSGQNALGAINSNLNALTAGFDPTKAGLSAQFKYGPDDFQVDPGYQFALQQGQQAIERSAAAKGVLNSGGTLKNLTGYTAGVASQQYNTARSRALNEYQQNYANAFNTYENNQSNAFNRLATLAGQGLSATGIANQAGQNYANQAGNYTIQGANAQAAGVVGGANALATGVSGATNALTNAYQNYLNTQSSYGAAPTTNANELAAMGMTTSLT